MFSGILCGDLWCEVLKYITVNRQDASAYYERRKNLQTLLNVALTNSTLSNVALSKLWRNLDSLEPIVNAINSSPSGRLLCCDHYGSSERNWVLQIPHNVNEIRLRVKEYLGRVRVFSITDPSEREIALWRTVAELLDNSNPVLPYLQQFSLSVRGHRLQGMIDPLVLLFPNSLKSLNLTTVVQEKSAEAETAILTFYRMLTSRGVELENFSYHGNINDELLLAIGSFKTIHALTMTHERKLTTRQNTTSISELIAQSPSLRSLHLDYYAVAPPGKLPSERLALREIELQIYPEDFLGNPPSFGRFTCPDLRSASLVLHRPNTLLSWTRIFDLLAQTFPYAETLNVRLEGDVNECPPLRIHDLDALFPKHIMRLHLQQVPYDLSTEDLIMLTKTWPDIRCFTLSGPGPFFDPVALSALSQMSHLEFLAIRVNCMALIMSEIDSLLEPQNVLTELCLIYPVWTSTLQTACKLARKLRLLFPRVRKIDAEGAIIFDLNEAIAALN